MSLGVLSSFRIVCVRGAGGPDAAANEEHDETSYRGVRNFECSLSFKSLRSALVSLTYKNEKADDRSPARSAVRLSLRGHAREISRTSRLAHLICAARSTATTSTQSSASHTARLHTIMDGFLHSTSRPPHQDTAGHTRPHGGLHVDAIWQTTEARAPDSLPAVLRCGNLSTHAHAPPNPGSWPRHERPKEGRRSRAPPPLPPPPSPQPPPSASASSGLGLT